MTDAVLHELAEIRRRLDGLADKVDDLAVIRAHVSGMPLIGSAIEVLQRDVRMIRAAINDSRADERHGWSRRCTRISSGCRRSKPGWKRGSRRWRAEPRSD